MSAFHALKGVESGWLISWMTPWLGAVVCAAAGFDDSTAALKVDGGDAQGAGAPLISFIHLDEKERRPIPPRSGRDRCVFGRAHPVVSGDCHLGSHPVLIYATVAQLAATFAC